MSALLSDIVYKMVEDKNLPIILDGTFFQIVKEIDNKVIDICVNCSTMSYQEPETQQAIFLLAC